MKRALLLLLFTVFLLIGCETHKAKKEKEKEWNGLECNLTSEKVIADSSILKSATIIIIDDYFIIKESYKDQIFSLFKRDGNRLTYINSFLSKGNGPYEVKGAYIYYLPEYNSIVLVSSNPKSKIFIIPLDDINNLFDLNKWRRYDCKSIMGLATSIEPLDTVSFLVHRSNDNSKMFLLYDVKEDKMSDLDILYPCQEEILPIETKSFNTYAGWLGKRPNSNQFIYSSYNGFFVKTFSIENNAVEHEKDIFDQYPNITITTSKSFSFDANEPSGLSPIVSQRYIYLCDPQLTLGGWDEDIKRNGYPAGYSKEIYVSDWDGKPIVKYMLDVPISYSAVDENEGYLYAFAYNDQTLESELVRFKLTDSYK